MGSKNTEMQLNESTGKVTITQDTTDIVADARRIRDLEGNSYYFNGDRKVTKRDSSGFITVCDQIITWSPIESYDYKCMSLNRDASILYGFGTISSAGSKGTFWSIDTATMTYSAISTLANGEFYIQCKVTRDNRVMALGFSNNLTIRDIDGANVSTQVSRGYGKDAAFALTRDNIAFSFSSFDSTSNADAGINISKYTLNVDDDLVLDTYTYAAKTEFTNFATLDMFVIDLTIYILGYIQSDGKVYLFKFEADEWNTNASWDAIVTGLTDLNASEGIEVIVTGSDYVDSTLSMYTDGNYGYILENNLTTNQRYWQFDLTTLSLKYLINNGAIDKFDTTGTALRIVFPFDSRRGDNAGSDLFSTGPTGGE